MAFQSCPFIVEAVVLGTIGAKTVANVLHFQRLSGYNQEQVDTLADSIGGTIGALYPGLIHAGVTVVSVQVRGLQDIIDLTSTSAIAAGTGTLTGESMPSNQSLAVKFTTGKTGRSARGRVYMFPTSTDSYAGVNELDAGYTNAAISLWTNVFDDARTDGWTPVVLSRFSANAKRLLGIGTEITGISLTNSTNDSQRGRLPKGH
jgi:hypothetical protein